MIEEEVEDLEELGEDEPEQEQEMYEHFRLEVDPGQNLLRIDRFLVDRLPNVSRTKIQEAAEAQCVQVNNKPVKSNYRVKPKDIVTLMLPHPKREIRVIPEDIPLNIVYEDDYLLVINKEPGMVVHPSYGHYTGTLVNALAWHLKGNPLFKENDPRPGLVHRIDKDTSGLLVIAKTEEAKTKLSSQFFHITSSRKYVAVCWGNLENDNETIIGNIGRSISNRKIMGVFPEGSDYGKHAVTHYHVLERLGYVNVVECVLETGRTHQIRAHFKSIRHPLFNDPEYGGNEILKGTTFTKYKQIVQKCSLSVPDKHYMPNPLVLNTRERANGWTSIPKYHRIFNSSLKNGGATWQTGNWKILNNLDKYVFQNTQYREYIHREI